MGEHAIRSGIPALDRLVSEFRLGDNVVWQVDTEDEYSHFAAPFAAAGIAQGHPVVYLRFAPHAPVLGEQPGLTVAAVDPHLGFDWFSRAVHRTLDENGPRTLYVFDNLSALASEWATDELLATFFQATCPYLFQLDTVTYFALTRGRHAHGAVARIRDTTQVLLDVYHVRDRMYVHPLKVWDRYSPQMFLPHLADGDDWPPVARSVDAAETGAMARRTPILGDAQCIAPWDAVYRELVQRRAGGLSACPAAGGERRATAAEAEAHDPELGALKRELRRMLIGGDPTFGEICDRYFSTADLLAVRERLVGSGRIGGNAAGMLLAQRILLGAPPTDGVDFAALLEEHDSFYIGSEVFFTFLVSNDLFRLRLHHTRRETMSREEFQEVEERFLAGRFAPAVTEQFRNILDYFGQAPIIVRSSSLLEDSFGDAFAGKYESVFCANQGDPEQRLEAFLSAVKRVYASTLNPDALSYRRRRGLEDSDEQMAVLVQRVSGSVHGHLFFPTLAGVAFSRNLYAWNDRIDPRQGVIRIVYGLGTRAVGRVGLDYPRMIAVSSPLLRPEVGARAARYTQRQVDVLDLSANQLATLPAAKVLGCAGQPALHYLVSILEGGDALDPPGNLIDCPPHKLVLTFNRLVRHTRFVRIVGAVLTTLEAAYGHPVDTEFTAFVNPDGSVRLQILQCRPLVLPGTAAGVAVRTDLPAERVLFRSSCMVGGGDVAEIRHILYIDPRWHAGIRDEETKRSLGRVVGRLNAHPRLAEGKILMMGPGRWGSSNIDLGVNVGYADIANAAVLVEVARQEGGHLPEVSYGTHFFQDLVEARILFLAVLPDDPDTCFQAGFFLDSPNSLAALLPDVAHMASVIRVIDVPAVTGGATARVTADPDTRRAICYLETPGGNAGR